MQSKIIANQHPPKMCMLLEKNPKKLKLKKQPEDSIIKNAINLFSLKKGIMLSKKEWLYILRTFLNNKKKIITNQ